MTPQKARPASSLADEGFATIREAMTYLSISRATLYALMDAGDLPYAKFRRCRRIPWQALREYATRNLVRQT
jgi:excisionase family DNA binding protein